MAEIVKVSHTMEELRLLLNKFFVNYFNDSTFPLDDGIITITYNPTSKLAELKININGTPISLIQKNVKNNTIEFPFPIKAEELEVDRLVVKEQINQKEVEYLRIQDQEIILNDGLTGNNDMSAIGNAQVSVNRGSLPKVSIKWNEITNTFEFTNDGVNFSPFLTKNANGYDFAKSNGIVLKIDTGLKIENTSFQFIFKSGQWYITDNVNGEFPLVPSATQEFATQQEVNTGVVNDKSVAPNTLKVYVQNQIQTAVDNLPDPPTVPTFANNTESLVGTVDNKIISPKTLKHVLDNTVVSGGGSSYITLLHTSDTLETLSNEYNIMSVGYFISQKSRHSQTLKLYFERFNTFTSSTPVPQSDIKITVEDSDGHIITVEENNIGIMSGSDLIYKTYELNCSTLNDKDLWTIKIYGKINNSLSETIYLNIARCKLYSVPSYDCSVNGMICVSPKIDFNNVGSYQLIDTKYVLAHQFFGDANSALEFVCKVNYYISHVLSDDTQFDPIVKVLVKAEHPITKSIITESIELNVKNNKSGKISIGRIPYPDAPASYLTVEIYVKNNVLPSQGYVELEHYELRMLS